MATPTPPVEVKLLKDENWKLIQQNTFTRWVNQQLKQTAENVQINSLDSDFSDGIVLVKLAEVLSGRRMARYNKKPTMRTQKLDNISLVLNFLQKEEGIKIVNIDSSHIADKNLKLILGLVWTLILHYSLSHRHFSSTTEQAEADVNVNDEKKRKETPKQRLLSWIQAKLPQQGIGNFTSNWNDGIALGALVDACLDGGFGQWREWKPEDGQENLRKAMRAAERELGVETLITPEELANPNVDEKSTMTYLAQFPKAQPRVPDSPFALEVSAAVDERAELVEDDDGRTMAKQQLSGNDDGKATARRQPLIERVPAPEEEEGELWHSQKQDTSSMMTAPSAVAAAEDEEEGEGVVVWGRGILAKGTSAREQLQVHVDNCPEEVKIDVVKDGLPVQLVEAIKNASQPFDAVHPRQSFAFTPQTSGIYEVAVTTTKGGKPCGKSPYKVIVGPENTSNIRAAGPGLEGGIVGVKSMFLVDTQGKTNQLEFAIEGPSQTEIECIDNGDGTAVVEYTPQKPGHYTIKIAELDRHGRPIRDSPFLIWVDPAEAAAAASKKCQSTKNAAYANGPGLAVGVVGRANEFTVWNVKEALGTGELTLAIDGPGKAEVSTCQHPTDDSCRVEYTVQRAGIYTISVLLDDAPIAGSPFKVYVKPPATETLSKHRELQHSRLEYSSKRTTEEEESYKPVIINFTESPEQQQNGGGTRRVHQQQQNKHHHNHYYNGDARLVDVSGEGLGHFVPDERNQFVVDTSRTGINTLFVGVITSHGPTEELNVRHEGDGKYLITYTVPFNTEAHIYVKYGELPVPGSPFVVNPAQKAAHHNNGNGGKDPYFSM